MRADAVGEQYHLFHQPVLDIAALAVPPVVDVLRATDNVRHDEPRIAVWSGMFPLAITY